MLKIGEAKKRLRDLYRYQEGFGGGGIGRRNNEDTLRVYVADARFSVAQQLADTERFEGFDGSSAGQPNLPKLGQLFQELCKDYFRQLFRCQAGIVQESGNPPATGLLITKGPRLIRLGRRFFAN